MATDITCNIPGGRHGNNPSPNEKRGNVVIDPADTVEAITWLRKIATITGTWITTANKEAPGLVILYEMNN